MLGNTASDSFYRFKQEHIVIGSEHMIPPSQIENAYKQFCEEEKMTPIPSNMIFDNLKSITGEPPQPTRVRGEQKRMWRGFTIASQLREKGQSSM